MMEHLPYILWFSKKKVTMILLLPLKNLPCLSIILIQEDLKVMVEVQITRITCFVVIVIKNMNIQISINLVHQQMPLQLTVLMFELQSRQHSSGFNRSWWWNYSRKAWSPCFFSPTKLIALVSHIGSGSNQVNDASTSHYGPSPYEPSTSGAIIVIYMTRLIFESLAKVSMITYVHLLIF